MEKPALPGSGASFSTRRHAIVSWLLLATGLVLSGTAAWFTHRLAEQEARLRFDADARDLQRRIENEIKNYEEVLVGLRSLFVSRDSISRSEFQRYVAALDLKTRYPGYQALNFAQVVRADQLGRFEDQVRKEGFESFAVRPRGERSEYQVITYIEPFHANLASFGLDIDANPGNAGARALMVDSGEIVTSGRLLRIDSAKEQVVALAMRLAVYRPGLPLATVDDRRRAFIGSVGAGYRVRDMMRGAVDFERLGHVRFQLYDRGAVAAPLSSSQPKAEMLLFDSRELAPTQIAAMYEQMDQRSSLSQTLSFVVGSRVWEVSFSTPLRLSTAERAIPFLVLVLGLMGSALFFRLYRQLTGSTRRAEASLRHLSLHDPLTGLANRLLFTNRLAEGVSRGNGTRAVMLVDLDRFKNINDSLGHGAGDAVLKACAERLQRTLRDSDLVAHLSGDEFAVIVEPCPQPAAAIAVARKILAALERPLFVQGHELVPTGSIGIAMQGDDGEDVETLLKHADIALFRAKEHGRNNFQFYSATHNPHSVQRLTLEAALRRALERDELALHYQPKLDLRSGDVVGVEALLRWNHPVLGMVSPAEFIPIAEETGLIEPIGAWVLREACRQSREWHNAGLDVRVAVNLSARQFRNDRFAADVRRCLGATGALATQIELELTESMVMQNAERAAQTLAELKAMGLTLSIDDFGTGHSSLAYLKRFPIDSLKIDRSFVKGLPSDAEDGAIVHSVIALARSMRLSVVAEGVETREQEIFLKNAGCDEMQGYLASKPLPAVEAAAFITRHRNGRARPSLVAV